MSQFNRGPKTFQTNEVIPKFSRVKLVSGSGTLVEAAGDNEACIGHVLYATVSNDDIAVDLINTGGTFKGIADGAITAGASVYAAASGEVTGTDGGGDTAFYTALEAADADGDIIELLPIALA
jgi:hypothetical protein